MLRARRTLPSLHPPYRAIPAALLRGVRLPAPSRAPRLAAWEIIASAWRLLERRAERAEITGALH